MRLVDPTGMGEENVNGGTLPEVEVKKELPYGDEYRSVEDGGCTAAITKCVLDFFNILSYDRNRVDRERNRHELGLAPIKYMNSVGGNVRNNENIKGANLYYRYVKDILEEFEVMEHNMVSAQGVYVLIIEESLSLSVPPYNTTQNHTIAVNSVRKIENEIYEMEYFDPRLGTFVRKKIDKESVRLVIQMLYIYSKVYNPWVK